MTASRRACTPLFLKEAPHSTGKRVMAMVPLRTAARSSSLLMGSPPTYFLHEVVVDLGQPLDHLLAILADEVDHVGGHGARLEFLAQGLVALVPHQGHLVDQVDEPLVVVLAADGNLNGHGMGAQALAQHVETAVEVGARPGPSC